MGVDEDAKAEDGTYGREQLTSRDQVQAAAGCIYVYIYIYMCVCVCELCTTAVPSRSTFHCATHVFIIHRS